MRPAAASGVSVAGLLVRHLGPTPIFPISGGLLALSMGYGLTQREFRDFGTATKPDPVGRRGGRHLGLGL